LARLKTGVKKELTGRAGQHETTVRISRFWLAPAETGFSRGGVKMVFPDRFILKGKTVPRELKSARSGGLAIFRHKQLACGAS
jgi:hypothetical protein